MRIRLLLSLFLLSSALQAGSIQVLSYNVYFRNTQQNHQKIIDFIKAHDYDLIALQEVTSSFTQMLQNDPVLGNYYQYTENIQKHYANLTLTKRPAQRHKVISYYSPMGRNAVSTLIHNVTFINVHLESMLEDTPVRIRQLQTILDQEYERFVILGDFNFGKEDVENTVFKEKVNNYTRYINGSTYDIEHNRLAARNAFEEEPSRFLDQIWGKGVDLSDIKILPLPYSDHYPVSFIMKIY